ncbi:hypothetical protein C7E12_22090, partial [Stenotrophomonas maltophilia]
RYRLEVAGDDGYRLYLDGKRVIDHWVNTDRLHAIRWSGQLLPPVSGRYRLEVAGDDGYRLYLDGKRVIDHWVNTDRLHA